MRWETKVRAINKAGDKRIQKSQMKVRHKPIDIFEETYERIE